MAKKQAKFKLTKKTKQGLLSCLAVPVEIILLAVSLYISCANRGNGGIIIGFIGVVVFVVAVFGTYLAVRVLRDKELDHFLARIGMWLNMLILVIMIMIIVYGISDTVTVN